MKKEELMEQMIQLVRENTDAADISGASSFMDDLEMSSMEICAFTGDLEAELGIRIPERVLNKAATLDELADEILKLL